MAHTMNKSTKVTLILSIYLIQNIEITPNITVLLQPHF